MSVFLLLSICGLIHVLFSVSCFNLCGSSGLFPFWIFFCHLPMQYWVTGLDQPARLFEFNWKCVFLFFNWLLHIDLCPGHGAWELSGSGSFPGVVRQWSLRCPAGCARNLAQGIGENVVLWRGNEQKGPQEYVLEMLGLHCMYWALEYQYPWWLFSKSIPSRIDAGRTCLKSRYPCNNQGYLHYKTSIWK